MPKFRTMKTDTPEVATDKLIDAQSHMIPLGSFLRKTSLDELPQLISVVKGDMTIVGPRPALYNQYELIEKRRELYIDSIHPGLTGYAQIMGRDALSIDEKVEYDLWYLNNRNIFLDLKIVFLTFNAIFKRSNIAH